MWFDLNIKNLYLVTAFAEAQLANTIHVVGLPRFIIYAHCFFILFFVAQTHQDAVPMWRHLWSLQIRAMFCRVEAAVMELGGQG
jgi:hypothetical protein